VRDLFTHPVAIAAQINTHDLKGLLVVIPVLGACFGSSLLLAAAPQLALLFLSRRSDDWLGINVLLIVPFVYAAALFTLERANRGRTGGLLPRLSAQRLFLAAFVVAALIGPFGLFGVSTALTARATPVSIQRHAVRLVPEHARVSATNHLALPLSAREHIYVFPVLRDAEWALVDSSDDRLPDVTYLRHRSGISVDVNELSPQPALMRRALEKLERDPGWTLVFQRDSVYAFHRTAAATSG
jgi:hypothetical protein